jgi:thioesterase domain-containing protein/acyl-coenzyme A synthetase/AMP-(fatty) acid ligase
VGVRLERSPELVAAIWGVLKAGGVLVPLDPAMPEERRRSIERDAGLDLVLDAIPGLPAADRPRGARPAAPPASATLVSYPAGLAGEPVGTVVEQRAIVDRLRWMQERYALGGGDAFLLWTPGGSLSSLCELLLPGVVGGRLVLAPPGDLDADAVVALVAGRGVTVLQIVPTLLPRFLGADDVGRCVGLRHLLCSGEALPGTLAAQAYARLRDVRVHGLHACGAAWECEAGDAGGLLPMGSPATNVTLHVLDRHLRPRPAGVPGALGVGGDGVPRGYLGRPALTADRFRPDPFGTPGARLHLPGEGARRRPDGAVERVPRPDAGARLRGYRADLEEVEAALLAHPDVVEALVTVEASAELTRAVAHVALRGMVGRVTTAELRKHLRRLGLPDYLVPWRFVYRPELPRLPDRTLDRRAPAGDQPAGETGYVAPRTKTEAVIAGICAEVLGVARVGVRDDFFELGGNSYLAAQWVARARVALEVDLSLRALFQGPTVADLALAADAEQWPGEDGDWSPLVMIQGGDGRPPLYAMAPVGGQSLCYFHLARSLGPYQPFYGLQPPEETPPDGITVEEIAASYVRAIVDFQPDPPYLVCGWSFGGLMAFETAQQLVRQGREVALLAIMDCFPGPYGEQWEDPLGSEISALLTIFQNERTLQFRADMMASDELMSMSSAERFKFARDWFEREGLLAPGTPLSWLRQLEHSWSARLAATYDYEFQPYPGPITLLRTAWDLERHHVHDWPEAMRRRVLQPALGWEDYCTHPGPIRVHTVPGEHATLVYGDGAAALAAHLVRMVAEVTGP